MQSTPIPHLPSYGRTTNSSLVLIIGAGISGLTTAIEMIRTGNGRDFIIVEQGNQVGGTWNDMRYPGCCCDVWSHLYSLSFEPNPNWTREYPGQEEILDYLIAIAHKYQLYKHIRFNTSVSSSHWDSSTSTWKTQLTRLGSKDAEFGQHYTITSSFLVSAVGQLNVPQYPSIPNISTFQGKSMHSARWDWDYDVRGKKVGIIGNGATAAQIIPEVARVCESLTVFQRTPNWVVPRDDRPISSTMQKVYKYVPFVRRRYRAQLMDWREEFFHVVFDRESEIHRVIKEGAQEHMVRQLPGEGYARLREKLEPQYDVGCKRVIVSDDFYPTFTRENVLLETTAIKLITEKGIEVEGGEEHEFDLLIYATGFKTTQFMYPIKIYGTDGQSLEKIWASGASAYLGITVPSLPNFSMLYGPNTNLGHNSIILMIEAQAKYINALISKVKQARDIGKTLRIEPKKEVVKAYNAEVQSKLSTSAFADPNCNSWYKNESGLITNNWSEAVIPYQKRTSSIEWDEFDISGNAAEEVYYQARKTSWPRVVEETQVSNAMILTGLITTAAAVVVGVLARGSYGNIFRR